MSQQAVKSETPVSEGEAARAPVAGLVAKGRAAMASLTGADQDRVDDAVRALESAHRPICFFGHTHVPVAYVQKGTDLSVLHLQPGGPETTVVNIIKKNRYLINPGSIGQPRDTDPRASYATYDSRKQRIEVRRVPYRIDLAQQRITEAGLPESLAFRLGLGR